MKSYSRGGKNGGFSLATSSTLCQKCLKKGHYSYECKAAAQERPYVSRPSRTQQLLNPKLVPKLSDEVPRDLLRKKGIADEQIGKFKEERGRKRYRHGEEPTVSSAAKRPRSISTNSVSVSTISTSPSISPDSQLRKSLSEKDIQRRNYRTKTRSKGSSKSPSNRRNLISEKRKIRESTSSQASDTSSEGRRPRSTKKRQKSSSSSGRGRNTQDKSPHASRKPNITHDQNSRKNIPQDTSTSLKEIGVVSFPRKPSLSPFSKRLALTQAMSMNQ